MVTCHTTVPRLLRLREWDCPCTMASPLEKNSHTGFIYTTYLSVCIFSSSPKTCGNGSMTKWQVKVITGSHSYKPACRWPLDQLFLIFTSMAGGAFGCIQGDWAALFRTALPTLTWWKWLGKVHQTLPALPCLAGLWQLADHPTSSQIKTKKKTSKDKWFIMGAWNVWILLDRDINSTLERRTALITKELAWCCIDINALSETRLADEGMLREAGAGYTFFLIGKPADEDMEWSLPLETSLIKDTPSPPVRISEYLMKLCFPLNRTHHVTIISAYAPTLTSLDKAKEQFYENLGHLIKATPPSDKLIILGDFNIRVGKSAMTGKEF